MKSSYGKYEIHNREILSGYHCSPKVDAWRQKHAENQHADSISAACKSGASFEIAMRIVMKKEESDWHERHDFS